MFDIDWMPYAALALIVIVTAAYFAGRASSRRTHSSINRIFLEELSPEMMTDRQHAVYASYCTLQNLKKTAADPTWEAFMLTLHGELWLPPTVTPDHLRGGGNIEAVVELVVESFPHRSAGVAVAA